MAIKDILLHLDAGGAAQAANEFAVSLAERFDAHLTAAAVATEIPPDAAAIGIVAPSGGFGGVDLFAKVNAIRRETLEKAYEKLQASLPPAVRCELIVIQSVEAEARENFARLARHFDLTVVAQRHLEPGQNCEIMLSAALFGSGRPLFIAPPSHKGPAKLEKPLLCWDGGVQAARALAFSLPLLALAGGVEVVHITGEANKTPLLSGFDITRHLARHGIEANLQELTAKGEVGARLLRHAREIGADYLVMGGYGHSRLAETLLGGATRMVLALAGLPIFMAH